MRFGFAWIAVVLSYSILFVGAMATPRAHGAGFVHSSNFTVFTPPVPSQEAADVFAKAVLERAEQLRQPGLASIPTGRA